MLNTLDLFSGIGGFTLGLDKTNGFKTLAFCELNEFCQRVLRKNWITIPIYSDIRELGRQKLNDDGILDIEVITGGFPCQDISIAGKGLGIDNGERSGLWREYYRLICEIRPKYVIVENVSMLLRRGIDRILADLAEIGYDAEWEMLSARDFGAPHLRERIFIIAYSSGQRMQGFGQSKNIGDAWIKKEWRPSRKDFMLSFPGTPFERGKSWPPPLIRGMDDGISDWAHRIKAIGNAVVPIMAQYIGDKVLRMETYGNRKSDRNSE